MISFYIEVRSCPNKEVLFGKGLGFHASKGSHVFWVSLPYSWLITLIRGCRAIYNRVKLVMLKNNQGKSPQHQSFSQQQDPNTLLKYRNFSTVCTIYIILMDSDAEKKAFHRFRVSWFTLTAQGFYYCKSAQNCFSPTSESLGMPLIG